MINTQSNVTPITAAMPQPSAKFSITCAIDGFPITVEIENANADKLRGMIDRLKAIGATPPSTVSPIGETVKSTPLCPVHNSAMKQGRRGYFCPKKVGDDYCKEVA